MAARDRVKISMTDYHWRTVQYALGKALEVEDINKYHRQQCLFAMRHIQRSIIDAENKKYYERD